MLRPVPALLLAALLAGAAVLVWPEVLDRWVPLDWNAGDVRPLARGVSGGLALLAAGMLVFARRVSGVARALAQQRRAAALVALTALASVAVSLVVVELAFRALDYPLGGSFEPAENALARFDPELGWSYRPGLSHSVRFLEGGPAIPVHFDAQGLRVASPTSALDPSAPSVLFVGGSFTMGHGVRYEATFVHGVEVLLGGAVQAVNLGVQGFGTDQSLLMLKRHLPRFDTRAVVYTFIGAHNQRNAVSDRRLLFPRSRFLGTKPRFAVTGGGRLELRETPARYDELVGLRLLDLVRLTWQRWGPRPSMRLTRALVREMQAVAEGRDARFLVVHWQGSHPASEESALRRVDPSLVIVDTGADAPEGWDDWTLPNDSHPNARAHAHVAQRVADALLRLGVRDGRDAPPDPGAPL